jgi:hypothetical protein
MVEFVRDVMIAVAILATLVAVAVKASADGEPKRQGSTIRTAVAVNESQAIDAPSLQPQSKAVTE